MKLSILLPVRLVLACTLLPTFCENGLKLENCHHISADNDTININQPINLPWRLQFELVNGSLNTVFSIRKKHELAFITPLNDKEELRIKYTKT